MVSNNKRLLAGLIGFLSGLLLIFSWLPLTFLLIIRKRYKLLFIPVIFVVAFIVVVALQQNLSDRTDELSDRIERDIFSIVYPTSAKYTETFFHDSIAGRIRLISDTIYFNDTINVRLNKLTSILYNAYNTEFDYNSQRSGTFILPLEKHKLIRKEIDAFSSAYIKSKHAGISKASFSLGIFLAIFSILNIPVSILLFVLYLFRDESETNLIYSQPPYPPSAVPYERNPQPTVPGRTIDNNINQTNSINYRTVRINYITAEGLSSNLHLTSIQSRTIINEREANGNFKDLSDFISRSGLSSRVCNHIGHYLDFSYEEGKGKKGRVIEF